jgi:signal transduction histidine kinase
LSLDVKAELLRIGQEAMHNIAKHAHARRVQLRLASEEASLLLEIADDGGGFDTNRQFPGHLGLVSMGERIQQLGGRLKVSSVIGQGTRIRAQIPLRASANLITAFAG